MTYENQTDRIVSLTAVLNSFSASMELKDIVDAELQNQIAQLTPRNGIMADLLNNRFRPKKSKR